jgi:hypothetical protein
MLPSAARGKTVHSPSKTQKFRRNRGEKRKIPLAFGGKRLYNIRAVQKKVPEQLFLMEDNQ